MFKFFRNIRKKFIDQDSVRKYMLYAIGEIVLVVVGILIALQINNWQTNKNDRKQEHFYLNKLLQNIAQDTFFLNDRLNHLQVAEVKLNQLALELKDEKFKEFSPDSALAQLISVSRFTPQTSTMDNLLSTGKLDLIRNQALVDSLFVYYNDLNNYTDQLNTSNDTYSRQTFGPGLINLKGGIFGLKKSALTDADKVFLANSIETKLFINAGLRNYYLTTSTRAKNIMAMLNQDIGNHY